MCTRRLKLFQWLAIERPVAYERGYIYMYVAGSSMGQPLEQLQPSCACAAITLMQIIGLTEVGVQLRWSCLRQLR